MGERIYATAHAWENAYVSAFERESVLHLHFASPIAASGRRYITLYYTSCNRTEVKQGDNNERVR